MTLNSFIFLVYFAILLMILLFLQMLRLLFQSNVTAEKMASRCQIILLLIFSYFFLAKSDWRFCLCVFAVTAIAYCAGLTHSKILKIGGGYCINRNIGIL